jgi:hypothetical protein
VFSIGDGQDVATLVVVQGQPGNGRTIARFYNLTLAPGGTITGGGDVYVYNQFYWGGGSMAGTGSTNIYGTAMIESDAGEVQGGRQFVNRGILNWVGSPGLPAEQENIGNIAPFWQLLGGVILNYGTFNINAPAGRTAQLWSGPDSWGGFQNFGTINGSSVENAQFNNIWFNMNNDDATPRGGTLNVTRGNFNFFDDSSDDGGMLIAAANCKIIFNGNTQFKFNAPDTMTGSGTFACEDAQVEIIAGRVTATNFILDGGTLMGGGTFAATYFLWQAGNLYSPDNALALCEVGSGGLFSIEGKNTDDDPDGRLNLGRQIKVFSGGRLEWGTDDVNEKDIAASGNASIVVFGRFDIGTNHEIVNDDESNCSLTIDAGGTMVIMANGGNVGVQTLRIGIPIANDDGTVNAWTSVDAESSGAGDGYSQTGDAAVINMSVGTYNFGGLLISEGQANLWGGTVGAANTGEDTIGTDAVFNGVGTITGGFICAGELNLTGGLTSTEKSFLNGGTVHLFGYTLTIQDRGGRGSRDRGWLYNNGGTIYLDNGTLTAAGAVVNQGAAGNDLVATITGSGTISAPHLYNLGGSQIIVGGESTPGGITLNGIFEQDGTSSIFVEIGGRLPLLQSDVFVINGTADLAGSLVVGLIGGYDPDPNNPLDVYTVIMYNSVIGNFSSYSAQAFLFDVDVSTTGVTIIPFSL